MPLQLVPRQDADVAGIHPCFHAMHDHCAGSKSEASGMV